MAMSMLHKMKDSGHPVQIIHGDNDSTTSSSLKLEFPEIRKKDDKNHIKKGISKKLYTLATKWKELKSQSSVIPYLVRCFMYALAKANTSGRSRSLMHRVSAAVLQKNEGHTWINKVLTVNNILILKIHKCWSKKCIK